ncbi:MAG TPA: KTSC domain-containing protein [Rhizomicrobium sp.]|nr:KTSC domain-containing protein [Rhizomicrobium sp.]
MPSAVIQSYSYNAETKELSILFRSDGLYVYEDVPPDTFDALNAAYSKGEYFQSRIRSKYDFHRPQS